MSPDQPKSQDDDGALELTGWLSFLSEGMGRKTVALIYVLCVLLAFLGCWVASFSPALGGPLLALATAFGVSWFFFEREYRPLNPQMHFRQVGEPTDDGPLSCHKGDSAASQDPTTEPVAEDTR